MLMRRDRKDIRDPRNPYFFHNDILHNAVILLLEILVYLLMHITYF